MKRVLCCVVSGLALAVVGVSAGQMPAAGQKLGIAESLQRGYAGVKANLTGNAEKMPDADYNFKPGSMPEVRAFGALFMHVANAQYGACAAAKGVANPNQGTISRRRKPRRQTSSRRSPIRSPSATMRSRRQPTRTRCQYIKQGRNEMTRAAALFGLIAHDNEMFGTSNVYLRAKGLVPASTERMQGRGRGRGGE